MEVAHTLTYHTGIRTILEKLKTIQIYYLNCHNGVIYWGKSLVFFANLCMWMCLPDVKILIFATPIFVPNYQPSVYHTNFVQKNTNFALKFCAFNDDLLKIHLCKLSTFVCCEPLLHYTKSCKKAPRQAGTHTIIHILCQREISLRIYSSWQSATNTNLSLWYLQLQFQLELFHHLLPCKQHQW